MAQAEGSLGDRAREADTDAVAQTPLVARARDGDAGAFDALVEMHLRRVYRIAYRFCWDREDAEDIAQDTFVRAFDRLRTLRSDADFAPWLYSIVVNRCLSHRARQERETAAESRLHPPILIGDDPETHAEVSAISSRVREEIGRLPKRQRAAIVLFGLEGWSVEETARIMDCSAGTVKQHLHRAKAALRKRLPDLQDDSGGERC